MWNKKRKEEIENIKQDLTNMRILLEQHTKEYAMLLEKTPPSTTEFANRIADLEVKMAKLWAVLVEIDKRGRDKPSQFARRKFGGQSFGLEPNKSN